MNKIVILTSGHYCTDERLFYKIGRSLSNNNFEVHIVSSLYKINETKNNTKLTGFTGNNLPRKEKINLFFKHVNEIKPGLILCAEILPIIPALKFKKNNPGCKIIYDVTEWYPENMTRNLTGIKKIIKYILLYLSSFYLIKKTDAVIVGEKRKLKRIDFFAQSKPKTIIPYYPPLSLFNYSPPPFKGEKITFCFTGHLNEERGILRFAEVIKLLATRHQEINFNVKLIGRFDSHVTQNNFKKVIAGLKNIQIKIIEWLDYENISSALSDVDICFDLRNKKFFFNNSLPIKLFEYMACGKPVIYSDIDAILDEFQSNEFGYFVDPFNKEEIANKIENYLTDKKLLRTHSECGRQLAETKYNWEVVENKLLDFINTVLRDA
jgi:glycosyltransferase involved in cell wall biosynthesis